MDLRADASGGGVGEEGGVFWEGAADDEDAAGDGVKLACRSDTGTVADGENAREMDMMLRAGVPGEEVLWAANKAEWEACWGGGEVWEIIWGGGGGGGGRFCGVGCGLEEG